VSRFVSEARDFRAAGEPRPIFATEDLLNTLGVSDQDRVEQQRAVDDWLSRNEPHDLLAYMLVQDGFVVGSPDGNVSNNLSNELRRTGTDDGGRAPVETAADLHRHGRRRTKADPPGRQTPS